MRPELLAADLMLEDHILDVGSLRGVQISAHTDHGKLRVPKFCRGGFNDEIGELYRLAGLAATRLNRQRRLIVAATSQWLPVSRDPEQITAAEHDAACRRLDSTPAGRKARELLFAHLNEEQRESAEYEGYFDELLIDHAWLERDLGLGRPPEIRVAAVRFTRFFPNGNVSMISEATGVPRKLTCCIHPSEPYPTDDIVLSQVLALRSDPDAFIREANITEDAQRVRFKGMWEAPTIPRLVDVCHS